MDFWECIFADQNVIPNRQSSMVVVVALVVVVVLQNVVAWTLALFVDAKQGLPLNGGRWVWIQTKSKTLASSPAFLFFVRSSKRGRRTKKKKSSHSFGFGPHRVRVTSDRDFCALEQRPMT